jgi:urease accessory protein
VNTGTRSRAKGGPGITQSDLLVINADLSVMDRDANTMRSGGPVVFAQATHDVGVDDVVEHVIHTWQAAKASAASPRSR